MDTGQNLNLGQSVTYNREDEIFQVDFITHLLLKGVRVRIERGYRDNQNLKRVR